MFELATPYSAGCRRAKVSVTKYRFLQQLLALELRARTPDRLHRSLENPSEPLSASTVWGITLARDPKQIFGMRSQIPGFMTEAHSNIAKTIEKP